MRFFIDKKFIGYGLLNILVFVNLCSCSEKSVESEYENWEARNSEYLDKIVTQAKENADGKWYVYMAYNLGKDTTLYEGNKKYFVYVHQTEEGSGISPEFKDSVRVHYKGRLIPSVSYSEGLVFDKSYASDTLNEKTDVPTLFSTGGLVTGFSTALQHMKEGERAMVYIPYYLGYGETTSGKIPGYSTLIFDIKLAKIYKLGSGESTDWY